MLSYFIIYKGDQKKKMLINTQTNKQHELLSNGKEKDRHRSVITPLRWQEIFPGICSGSEIVDKDVTPGESIEDKSRESIKNWQHKEMEESSEKKSDRLPFHGVRAWSAVTMTDRPVQRSPAGWVTSRRVGTSHGAGAQQTWRVNSLSKERTTLPPEPPAEDERGGWTGHWSWATPEVERPDPSPPPGETT